jgi:hypothetical protein
MKGKVLELEIGGGDFHPKFDRGKAGLGRLPLFDLSQLLLLQTEDQVFCDCTSSKQRVQSFRHSFDPLAGFLLALDY